MTAPDNAADGPNAFPDLLGDVTIIGNGATITRDGASKDFRFFLVDDGGSLNVSNLTFSNGSITNDVGFTHGGGAILNRSHLTVTGVTFLNNHEQGTPPGVGGGAVDNHDKGILTVTNSTFTGNSAPQGGAIEDEATLCDTSGACGSASVTNSTFRNNSTANFGGGAFESQLDAATPAQCSGTPPYPADCQQVGGAHDVLTGNTFSGNTAAGEGGAIANFGTTTVTNTTITGNSAGSQGGGGVQNTGVMTITETTIVDNTSSNGPNLHTYDDGHASATITVSLSIVSGSITNCSGTGGTISDGGFNLDSGSSCGFTNNAQNNTDPMLGSLASNGGPTQTRLPGPGSNAIDNAGACTGTDQRGVPRPQGPACDIGSVEIYKTPPTVPGGLTATAAAHAAEIDLSWSASSSLIVVAGYDVYRDGASTPNAIVSGTTLTFADTGLNDATTYSYKVDAFDVDGNHSAQSSPAVSATTPDITSPSVPGGLSAVALTNAPQVNLSWNASSDNVGVVGYDIYRNGSSTPLAMVGGSTLGYADTPVAAATTYSYRVDAFDAAGNHSAQSAAVSLITPGYTSYTAVTPVRLLDTRNTRQTLGPGSSLNLSIAGISAPANATAVVLNVTATNGSTAGAFVVYPTGAPRPLASNLNWTANQTVPNLVMVGLGGGSVTITNLVGTADAVVDLEGYYAPANGTSAGGYLGVVPARITDTRAGSGQPNAGLRLGPGTTLNVQVLGAGGIPASGVSAVVMNVTATNTSSAGFFTAFPTGHARPLASNLNWVMGQTVPNRVIVPVGSGGKVSFYNGVGSADLIVDVNGYFTDDTKLGASFSALVPNRIVDTRYGTGGFSSPLGPGQTMVVTVAGHGGVPAMGTANPPGAVVLNVTVTGASANSDLTVWPSGASAPVASDLNFTQGQTVANLVIVKLSADGKIAIRNDFGSTSVVIDVVGWYGAAPA